MSASATNRIEARRGLAAFSKSVRECGTCLIMIDLRDWRGGIGLTLGWRNEPPRSVRRAMFTEHGGQR